MLALSACTDEVLVGGSLAQTEAHVDTTQLTALADTRIVFDAIGGDRSHYISVEGGQAPTSPVPARSSPL